MKRNLITIFALACALLGQAQTISLDDVVYYRYSPRGIYGLQPMPDGDSYSKISDDGRKILQCSYETDEVVATLLDLAAATGQAPDRLGSYTLAPDGKHILLETSRQSIYRRSYTAQYYVYSVDGRTVRPLSSGGPQECARFSPDGRLVAFVRDNNLFYVDLATAAETQVTTDGLFNHVINGKPDWVYEEEFEFNCAYDFSADSKTIAWIRFDETDVPMFRFQVFQGDAPRRTEYALYPGFYEYKYPKAGQANSKVAVLAYSIPDRATHTIQVPLDSDGYIPRIQFTKDPRRLAVVTLNRRQNQCSIYQADPATGQCKLLISEQNDKYVDLPFYKDLDLKGDQYVFLSDRDGYQHLYLYDTNGRLRRQLTSGKYVVTDYYGTDGTYHYYAANEGSPLEQYIFRVDEKGRRTRLTNNKGFNTATFSQGCHYFINTFSDINTPPVTTLYDCRGKQIRTLKRNDDIQQAYQQLQLSTPRLFTFTTSEGVQLNGWMLLPKELDNQWTASGATSPEALAAADGKTYPVLMYQYSGPGNQQVYNSWNNGFGAGLLWEHRLAQKGYIVACVDGRGTGGRGADFQKCTYCTMGDLESRDQVETAQYLARLPYVDPSRIAIWGWSFGGFNTIMSMTDGRKVFNCGVAVAPVTDWRFYDSAYTERYMRTPQENPDGYDISPLHRFQKLQGDLLIIHGLADDNVHFQNTAELVEQLTQAGIQFQMQTYTNRDHGISGGNTRRHLFTRIENYLDQHLRP